MTRVSLIGVALFATVVLIGAAYAQKTPDRTDRGQASRDPKPRQQAGDTLEGTLRIHPKFHYRYYIDEFGDGQECALFRADDRLANIEPGTPIRVRGDLASRFFGNPNDRTSAIVSTWIIYMNVDVVEVLRRKDEPSARRSPP